jgi:isochorismate synthase
VATLIDRHGGEAIKSPPTTGSQVSLQNPVACTSTAVARAGVVVMDGDRDVDSVGSHRGAHVRQRRPSRRAIPVGRSEPGLPSERMLVSPSDLEALGDALRDRPDRDGGGLSSVSIPVDVDPLDLVRAGASAVGHSSYFSSPDGTTVGALGAARRLIASGRGRLLDLDGRIVDLAGSVPVMVGFAFHETGSSGTAWEGFPASTAIIPEVAVMSDGDGARLVVTPPLGSDGRSQLDLLAGLRDPGLADLTAGTVLGIESRPSPEDWQASVAEAIRAIRSGALGKVVLARTVMVRSQRSRAPFDLVALLRERYSSSRVFGWQDGRARAFVGASPELLVARRGDAFVAEPLAGTAPRGQDPEADRRIGDELMASTKDRSEHAVVVDDAVTRLSALCDEVTRAPSPRLQRFATVQHLATPITGRTSARVLELADALHPTPAVGGAPRGAALAFIEKHEGIDRGWYSGGIGWSDSTGNGEIAVGLRSALLFDDRAILYAGSGIVAASDPDAELEETRLKLRPMLDLLTGV